jgi:hypothetical protein
MMNVTHSSANPGFEHPVDTPSTGDDDDLKYVNPRFPKAAAGFALLAGGLGMLTGIQALLTVRILSPLWAVVPYVLIALGGTIVVLSLGVFVARPLAAMGAMAVGALLAAASGAWLIFAVSNGFIALYALWTPVWAGVAVGFCGAALAPCHRAQRVRDRLRREGMALGL